MNTTKKSLFTSLVACFVLLSMLMGTTFAWFTDIVSSENNVIQSGSLNAEMYWSDKLLAADSDEWIDASAGAVFNHDNWEPGYTQVRYVKVVNNGSLKFKWQLSIAANGKVTALSDAIDVYYVNPVSATLTSLDGLTSVGTLTDVLDGNTAEAGRLDPDAYQILAIAFHMDEYAGNEYQDMSLCEAGFSLKLIATQATGEFDSFDDQYDADAEWPYVAIKYSESEDISDKIDTTTGSLTEDVTIGETTDDQYAEIPSDVKLADGADKLTLKIESIETPNKSVPVATGESAKSVDVHIDGLAEDNTVPVTVTLKKLFDTGLNTTSVKLYHVENGTPVAMTLVSNPVNHNEFSYDPATGDVVMTVATFSEYVPVTNDWNKWEGEFDYSWYTGKSSPYTISSADQLAGFGRIVDGTAEGIEQHSFADETVLLGADIDLAGGVSLNPIGCGYVNGTTNSNNVTGYSFEGTFDGQDHVIRNLYQNGWDLGLSYNNLGGGLFGSIHNAIIQNLTMVNANIVMECVEQGVIAGLAQGDCKFLNININNCSVANYQKATGGVVGEVSWGAGEAPEFTHRFENITIDAQTVVGSLWGDFDAPVGGVIGARWDDSDRTKVVMNNVTVACRLDVYNDVTSTYQWYNYRRAGMLIGNTDTPVADGKNGQIAAADFLTCDNVNVYIGSWRKYHYCEFGAYNSSWPWVRVEAGENCSAYSNPRYGVPSFDGKPVDSTHTEDLHQSGEGHNLEITFNQLYGGGQGVKGKVDHPNVTVTEYDYAIIYINNGVTLDTKYVTNEAAQRTENAEAAEVAVNSMLTIDPDGDYKFDHWMNAGSTPIDTVAAGNTSDVILYPSFKDVYTVTYVDDQGNILHWENIHAGDKTTDITPEVPEIEGGYTGVWSIIDFSNIESDVTVYPIYNADDGIVKLTPVDSEPKDGIVDYYQVTNVKEDDSNVNIVIPASFNGKPVIEVTGGAFAEFDNITTVKIPTSITTIGADAFANKENSGVLGALKYEQITFLYEGTYEQWQAITKDANWDRYVGQGSRIYFLADGTYSEETARNGTGFLGDTPARVWSDPKEGTYTAP